MRKSEFYKYTESLIRHPGVPIATVLLLFGFLAGGFGGAAIMAVFWIPVLLTAWGMRNKND